MLNQLAKQFLTIGDKFTALDMLRQAKDLKCHNIGRVLGKFFEKVFPKSPLIKDEYAKCSYFLNNLKDSHRIFNRMLVMRGLPQNLVKNAIFNQHFSINKVSDQYIDYSPELVSKIMNRESKNFPVVTFTITSCKRFDLFEKTMNSFIKSCLDIHLIDKWICVDDNSSKKDIDNMKRLYPFFYFIWKDESEKGHPRSMNIIRKMINTPYVFHMEDDWMFFSKRTYISDCMEVLNSNTTIQQCLINKNYSEVESDVSIVGGIESTTQAGLRYYVHEKVTTEKEKQVWVKKYGKYNKHCNYWPHYSFRPSLFRAPVVFGLGEFNETSSHFEMEYSTRYCNKGYKSAFLEGIYCLHTGRLTSERHDKTKENAYTLNNQSQFNEKSTEIIKKICNEDFSEVKFSVLNLDRRPDRFSDFTNNAKINSGLTFERFRAIDGNNLVSTPQLQRIFDGNDYNMRVGLVGCAMSHILMYTKFLKSDYNIYCILEDDVLLVPDFDKKLQYAISQVDQHKWDLLYLGHHLFKDYITDSIYDKTAMPIVEKWDSRLSLRKSMGGTGGYLITKAGALKLLNFINITGMTNGIDTIQQKSADELNIFYSNPHLIYSECCRGGNNPDTDIQNDYTSLAVDVQTRLEGEIAFYEGKLTKVKSKDILLSIIQNKTKMTDPVYYESDDVNIIKDICSKSKIPSYTLGDKVIIIGNKYRYFDRLKKDGKYNLDDAIKYK
jgi:GR25 family glycosyltransferase involved in LPS biosynthesis